MMKRKILMSLVVLGCLNPLFAQNEVLIADVDRAVQVKQSNAQHLDELVITIKIKTKETLAEGVKALKSLRSNLDFINKVATSKSFRDCVIAKEYKKDVLAKQKTAQRMLQEQKITQEQYKEYQKNQESALSSLNEKISNICKEGE